MLIHPDKSGLNVNGENTHFLSSLFLESLLSPGLPEGQQFYSLNLNVWSQGNTREKSHCSSQSDT